MLLGGGAVRAEGLEGVALGIGRCGEHKLDVSWRTVACTSDEKPPKSPRLDASRCELAAVIEIRNRP